MTFGGDDGSCRSIPVTRGETNTKEAVDDRNSKEILVGQSDLVVNTLWVGARLYSVVAGISCHSD